MEPGKDKEAEEMLEETHETSPPSPPHPSAGVGDVVWRRHVGPRRGGRLRRGDTVLCPSQLDEYQAPSGMGWVQRQRTVWQGWRRWCCIWVMTGCGLDTRLEGGVVVVVWVVLAVGGVANGPGVQRAGCDPDKGQPAGRARVGRC